MNKLEFTNKVLDNLNDSISEDGKVGLAKFIELTNNLYEAINYTPCCTELKTVKQGEKLVLDNKFDVEVVTPESSVLIKHKDKDRLIWVDKQRLKRN